MNRPAEAEASVTPYPESLIGRLRALTEALREADQVCSGGRYGPGLVVVEIAGLLQASREVTTAAGPVIGKAVTLSAALRDAAADRRDVPDWCRDCRNTRGGLCGDHRSDLSRAEMYDLLHGLLFGLPDRL